MATETLRVPEKLLSSVYASYPVTLADPFVRLAAELGRLHPNPETVFNRCLDSFEISVKFVGLAAAAAYLQRVGAQSCARSTAAEKCILRLRQNDKPALGHWFELLRTSLAAIPDGGGCMSELARAYNSSRPLRDGLDEIPKIRNSSPRGHGKNWLVAEYERAVPGLYQVLEQWYWALDIFENHWLARVVKCEPDGDSYQAELELRRGNNQCFPRLCVPSAIALQEKFLYLVESPGDAGIREERRPLLLHPFMIVDPENDPLSDQSKEGPGDVVVFELYTDKEVKYDCRRSGPPYLAKNLHDDFTTALGPVLATHGKFAGMPWEVYQFIKPYSDRLRERSLQFLDRQRRQKTFVSELQVPREEPEARLREFLDSDKAALIISGTSGIGKTCLVCGWAEGKLKIEDSDTLVLLLGADALPQSDISIERAVREALGISGSVQSWVAEVGKRFRRNYKGAWRLVVIIDGIDKHPNIGRMIAAIEEWVRTIPGSMSELKLIATCSPTGLDRARAEIAQLSVGRYFAPVREILAGEPGPLRLPSVQMAAFTDEERKEAYAKYQQSDAKPVTRYVELKPGARRVLSHPLFMRLVNEAYRNEEVPANPISFQTLQKYCEPSIFSERGRKAFVDCLLDLMLERRVREVSGEEIAADAHLRDPYLGLQPTFEELLNDQVLSAYRRLKTQFPAPIEVEYVAFAMDRVFQFLLVVRLLERHGGTPEQFLESGLGKALDIARVFPSLEAGLVDLLAEVARNPVALDQKKQVFCRLFQLWGGGEDEWLRELLADVVTALADEVGSETEERDPFRSVVSWALETVGQNALRLLHTAVQSLFRRAMWDAAIVLLRQLADSATLSDMDRFFVQNQLMVVLKNQDKWPEAKAVSDANDALLSRIGNQAEVSPKLRARHWLNRFSVLYDVGQREEALRLCEQANRLARQHPLELNLELAATANNLGIAYVYFDRPCEAEQRLSEGIEAAGKNEIIAGHNYLDRGLVRMVQWQLGTRDSLEDARKDIDAALTRFKNNEYAQGILYGHASIGLIHLYEAMTTRKSFAGIPVAEWSSHPDFAKYADDLKNAQAKMTIGLDMAIQLGEDWPNYGIQTDLALWCLQQEPPDLAQALEKAETAYKLVVEKEDPEGTSIIAMVLARILIESQGDPGRIRELLKDAEEAFVELGFYSAAARAAAGRIEAAALTGEDPSPHIVRRQDYRSHLNPAEFPSDFAEKFEPMDWKLLFLAELF